MRRLGISPAFAKPHARGTCLWTCVPRALKKAHLSRMPLPKMSGMNTLAPVLGYE